MFQSLIISQFIARQNQDALQSAYADFTAHFHNADIQTNIKNSKEEQYQEGFLKDLFVNILGYTLNPQPNFNLTTELKNQKGSKKCDGAIIKDDHAICVIELKGMDTTDLDRIEEQAFGYKNNQPNCRYVITSNFQKLRFYIDNSVEHLEFDLFNLSYDKFSLLYTLLHRDNLLTDTPLQLKQASISQEEKITKQLYQDYSAFKRALFADLIASNSQIDQLTLFNKTQKLLDRLLFIFFAEDRQLLPANTAHKMIKEWQQAKALNIPMSVYSHLKNYFNYLNTGYKSDSVEIFAYNGGLFKPDEILDNLTISDEVLYEHITRLADYDFNSEIDVNILGHIFENSLNEIDEIKAKIAGETLDKSQTKRKKDGVFYTPKYITSYIVQNTVGKLCAEKRAEFGVIDDEYTPNRQKKTQEKLYQNLQNYREWLLTMTICDPACGSGAFLNEALNFLIAEHSYLDELESKLTGSGLQYQNIANHILENNLFGVDINAESVEIAKLSLWLRTAQPHRKLSNLNENIKCGNSLIDDESVAGDKAFDWAKEFPQVFEKGGFDVVIGNPPYLNMTQNNTDNQWLNFYIQNYESIKKANSKNLYTLFNEKAVHLLKDNGLLSFIIPEGFLKTRSYVDCVNAMRNYGTITKAVYFEDWVFEDATTGSVIFEFIAAKDDNLGFQEVLFTKDREVIELNTKNPIVEKYNELHFPALSDISDTFKGMAVKDRKNFVFDEKNPENQDLFLLGNCIDRYLVKNQFFTNYDNLTITGGTKKKEKYQVFPRILIRRTGDYLCCSFVNEVAYTESTLYSTSITNENFSIYYLLAILNAKFLSYIVKQNMITNEQAFPQILMTDLLSLKIPEISLSEQQPFIAKAEQMLSLNQALQETVDKFLRTLNRKFDLSDFSKNLQNWHLLDYKAFIKELAKKKIKLSLGDEAEWEDYFVAEQAKAQSLQNQIAQTDDDINQMVYALYGLTDDEIKIIE